MLRSIIPDIQTTIARSAPVGPQQHLELESRFGTFTSTGFVNGVTREQFYRVMTRLSARGQGITELSTDYLNTPIRKTTTGDTTTWIRKERLFSRDLEDYGVRISISMETAIDPPQIFNPTATRIKNRTSFFLLNGRGRVDLTAVEMHYANGASESVFEIENEPIDPTDVNYLEVATGSTLKILLDTPNIYTETERLGVVNRLNRLLRGKPGPSLDGRLLVQARNLKLRDMVWGGLIGGRSTGYTVTHKADGLRKLLFFDPTGVWLIMPNEYALVTRDTFSDIYGTVLDGELIPKSSRLNGAPSATNWFVGFDCMAFRGDIGIQDQPHGSRMGALQQVADRYKTREDLYITTKTFLSFNTVEQFQTIMSQMFNQQASLAFRQDGFMFTPETTVYNPRSNQYPLYKRVLTRYPDICKWKPKEKLTIDFMYELIAEGKVRLTTIGTNGAVEEFRGSTINPFNPERMIETKNPITSNVPNGSIVEYGWDYTRHILIPHLVRTNKTRPNNTLIAMDVWDDIHNPIEASTLTGDSFALLRAYHNRVKRSLFSGAVSNGATLLDIGSGRGGDVSKWSGYSRVIAVEPNSEHITELNRRIQLQGAQNKVTVVQAGGEDTEVILRALRGVRVDVISLMLSMSFFWQSADKVQSLARTISQSLKPGGQVIFLTIDGESLEQVFNPAFSYEGTSVSTQNKMTLGPATIEYFKNEVPPRVHVNITGTIVSEQDEWPVHIYDLLGYLGVDFTLSELHRVESENFLSPKETLYTQMYSAGVIKRSASSSVQPLPSTLEESLSTPNITLVRSPTLQSAYQEIQAPLATVTQTPLVPEVVPSVPIIIPASAPLELEVPNLPVIRITPRAATPRREMKELGSMHVINSFVPGAPGKGDDEIQLLVVPWYTEYPVYRMATIGDGSCFFHAVLKAIYGPYQDAKAYDARQSMTRRLRRDLSWLLDQPFPGDEKKTYWESSPVFTEGNSLGLTSGTDYSLKGLQRLFNSSSWVGQEAYSYVSEVLGIDIYVMIARQDDLQPVYKPDTVHPEWPSIVISGNGSHFEAVVLKVQDGLLQTVFPYDHSFITAIQNRRGR